MARWLIVVLWVTNAWALGPGSTLYVASPEVTVRDAPSLKGKSVLTLKRGEEVKWLGVSPKDKSFHQIESAGKKGFVHLADLSPAKPQQEVTSAPSTEPVPFAQSGAATKTPAIPSATRPEDAEAMRAIEQLEALNAAAATPEALAKKRREISGQR
jgi:hypothetical protein